MNNQRQDLSDLEKIYRGQKSASESTTSTIDSKQEQKKLDGLLSEIQTEYDRSEQDKVRREREGQQYGFNNNTEEDYEPFSDPKDDAIQATNLIQPDNEYEDIQLNRRYACESFKVLQQMRKYFFLSILLALPVAVFIGDQIIQNYNQYVLQQPADKARIIVLYNVDIVSLILYSIFSLILLYYVYQIFRIKSQQQFKFTDDLEIQQQFFILSCYIIGIGAIWFLIKQLYIIYNTPHPNNNQNKQNQKEKEIEQYNQTVNDVLFLIVYFIINSSFIVVQGSIFKTFMNYKTEYCKLQNQLRSFVQTEYYENNTTESDSHDQAGEQLEDGQERIFIKNPKQQQQQKSQQQHQQQNSNTENAQLVQRNDSDNQFLNTEDSMYMEALQIDTVQSDDD